MFPRSLLIFVALVGFTAPAAAVPIIANPTIVSASSGQLSIDNSTDIDVIQFDLQAAFDVSYLAFNHLQGADFIEIDATQGFIDDIFGDVGAGDPIAAGSTLFTLIFDVVGSPDPARTILEVGDLSSLDPAFFDRAVLVADPDFNVFGASPNATVTAMPEPSPLALMALGLFVPAAVRRCRTG